MGKIKGFLEHTREVPQRRPVQERVGDYLEVYLPSRRTRSGRKLPAAWIAACPSAIRAAAGKRHPDFNDHAYRERWKDAIRLLHSTTIFPSSPAGFARRRAKPPACWGSRTCRHDQGDRKDHHRACFQRRLDQA